MGRSNQGRGIFATAQLPRDARERDREVGLLRAATRLAQAGLGHDRVAVGAERSAHALIEVLRACGLSRDRPDAALERHVEYAMRPAGVEPVKRESAVRARCTHDREVVRKVRVIHGRALHEEGPISPPLEHAMAADYLVRYGDVSAF